MTTALAPAARALWLFATASLLFLVSAAGAAAVDAAIVLLTLLDGRRARLPSATRHAPATLSLGEEGEVAIELANPGPHDVKVRLTDDVGPSLARAKAGDGGGWERFASVVVPAGGTVRRLYRVRPRVRGFLELGNIHVRALGPWGLAWKQAETACTDTIRVQPGIREFRRRASRAVRRPLAGAGRRRLRRKGDGREFESLRDYVRGDDPRTLDWKVSAKRGRLAVRTYQAERHQNVVLAIDAGRHMRERVLDRERADFALAAALLLASRARAYGDRVGLLVFDDEVRYVSPPRRPNPAQLAEALAGVRTRLVEPNYPVALATLARTFRKRSLLILFCDVIDETVSRALVRSLARAARVHLPLAVAIRNPDLDAAARAPARDERAAFDRAAAEELVQARATALAAMRRSGILAADVHPNDTLARSLDMYVEIRERGLL